MCLRLNFRTFRGIGFVGIWTFLSFGLKKREKRETDTERIREIESA